MPNYRRSCGRCRTRDWSARQSHREDHRRRVLGGVFKRRRSGSSSHPVPDPLIKELTIDQVDDRRIAFSVGINIGDLIVEQHDIFGDGVIIAARLSDSRQTWNGFSNSQGRPGVSPRTTLKYLEAFGLQD
jgi:hypothetical protein